MTADDRLSRTPQKDPRPESFLNLACQTFESSRMFMRNKQEGQVRRTFTQFFFDLAAHVIDRGRQVRITRMAG